MLFDRWSKKYSSFVVDGSPNPAAFEASRLRTVFVLKDINAPDEQGLFDLRSQLEKNPHPWWRTVANWCAALSRSQEEVLWSHLQEAPIRQCLEQFAFVQLKKTPGVGSILNASIAEYARQDAAEIRAQLLIYRPTVIVCAGVGNILHSVLDEAAPWRSTARGIRYAEVELLDGTGSVLIDYMHPSARAQKSVICYGLLDAYREVTGVFPGA